MTYLCYPTQLSLPEEWGVTFLGQMQRRCCWFRNVTTCLLCYVCVNIQGLSCYLTTFQALLPLFILLRDFTPRARRLRDSLYIWHVNPAYGYQGFGTCLMWWWWFGVCVPRSSVSSVSMQLLQHFKNSYITFNWSKAVSLHFSYRVQTGKKLIS